VLTQVFRACAAVSISIPAGADACGAYIAIAGLQVCAEDADGRRHVIAFIVIIIIATAHVEGCTRTCRCSSCSWMVSVSAACCERKG